MGYNARVSSSKRIKGVRDLVFDGVEIVTNLVQRTHGEVSDRWTERAAMIEPAAPIARGVNAVQKTGAAMTYATIRFVSRGVGAVTRAVTDPILDEVVDDVEAQSGSPMRQDAQGTLTWWLDQAEGSLNGFFGDHLARRGNTLDLGITLRHEGTVVDIDRAALDAVLPNAGAKVCVFVHGLSATEWSWVLFADRFWDDSKTCYATKLEEDLGYTPLFVRYNSGRHVSENGRALAQLLTELCDVYPVPIEEITIVGHSMGGLVSRSAAHYGASTDAPWAELLRHVFCIGSPHFGAPLEKGVNVLSAVLRSIPAAGATVPAAVLDARSAGIKDLRHGYTIDEEWRGEALPPLDGLEAVLHDNRHDVPLVAGVGYYAVATTITKDPEHPAGRLLGDLLVRAASGSGAAPEPERHIAFHSRKVIPGMNHLHIANHPAVYEMLVRCLEGEAISD
jgi:pimeloyl-ACP methyl ester carboxylesterase